MSGNEAIEGITLVPQPTKEQLNDREYVDYEEHRRSLIQWALQFGKDPDRAKGYATTTVQNRAYRIDKFYRWVWNEKDGYTTEITTDDADVYMEELAFSE